MPKYLAVILLFCFGKWWHQTASAEDLLFLLTPTDLFVSAALGEPGIWQAGEGYLHENHRMIINASCAGFNFFVLSFLMLAWLLLDRYKAWWTLTAALTLALPLTILANTSRILTITLLGEASPAGLGTGVWHEVQGAFVYFSILVITAVAFRSLRTKNNAVKTSSLSLENPEPQAR